MRILWLASLFLVVVGSFFASQAYAQTSPSFINCAGVYDYIGLLEEQCAKIRRAHWDAECADEIGAFRNAYEAFLNAGCYGENAGTEHCKELRQALENANANQQNCQADADLSDDYLNCRRDVSDLYRAYFKVCRQK